MAAEIAEPYAVISLGEVEVLHPVASCFAFEGVGAVMLSQLFASMLLQLLLLFSVLVAPVNPDRESWRRLYEL